MANIVKFFLKTGPIGELEVAVVEPFNFPSFVQRIKCDGYFCNDAAFIPYDSIQSIMFGERARLQNIASTPMPEGKMQ